MKNSVFDFRLFREYMKQLRVVGIVATIIICINALIVPIAYLVTFLTRQANDIGVTIFDIVGMGSLTNSSVYNFNKIHPSLVSVYLIMAPVLTLIAFSFMNKRRTCDFWHSIPQTRTCLFVSIFSAVFAWIFFAATASTILSVGVSLCMTQLYTLNIATIFSSYLCCLAGALLEIGAVALAMTITGNAFSNIIVSLLIIGFPRALMSFIALPVTISPIIAKGITADLLSNNLNVVTGTIFSIFDTPLKSFAPAAYTAVLGLFYAFFALLIFRKRKSEFAAQSAPNNILQATYRILITLFFCAIPLFLIFSAITSYESDPSLIYFIIVLYVIALIIYFVYEIITTRKPKNLLIALPQLGILVVANLLILGAMFAYYNFETSFTPTADTTDSVQIQDDNSYSLKDSLLNKDYFAAKAGITEIRDKRIIELLCDEYNSYRDEHLESLNGFSPYSPYGYVDYVDLTVGFNSPLGYRYRYVSVERDTFDELIETLSKNESFRSAYTDLPKLGENNCTVSVVASQANMFGEEIAESNGNEIYTALREDVKELGFDKWYMLLTEYRNQTDTDQFVVAYANISVSIGADNYNCELPITDTTERAFACVVEYLNEVTVSEKQGMLDDMIEYFNDSNTEDIGKYTEYTLCVYEPDSQIPTEYYYVSDREEAENLKSVLVPTIDITPTLDTRICFITTGGTFSEYHTYLFVLPDEADLSFFGK